MSSVVSSGATGWRRSAWALVAVGVGVGLLLGQEVLEPTREVSLADTGESGLAEVPAGLEVFPISPGMVFERYESGVGGQEGTAGAERLIYSNTFGTFGAAAQAGSRWADDLATSSIPWTLGVNPACGLKRIEFPVLGRVDPLGVGGAYTVNFELFSGCPGSVSQAGLNAIRIPGSAGQAVFTDDGPHLISHTYVNSLAIRNTVWLAVTFSRSNAGMVVGSPAQQGFSCDKYDSFGAACNASHGGFPAYPYAAFNVQLFGEATCNDAFVAYRANRASGPIYNPGANLVVTDDIELDAPGCQMVSYEVAVRGPGLYFFSLRSQCDSNPIDGTERAISSSGTDPRIFRFLFDPPIAIPRNFSFAASVSNAIGGVITTGEQACVGRTEDFYQVPAEGGGCTNITPMAGVHSATNLTITCAGAAPLGACCDPYDPNGEGEAVCRDTAAMNCFAPPRGDEMAPGWIAGASCDESPFARPCGPAACCLPDGVCEDLSRAECTERGGGFYADGLCGLYGPRCVPTTNLCGADSASPCVVSDLGVCSVGGQGCTLDTECAVGEHCQYPRGCADPSCCSVVCELEPTCCDVPGWTAGCAELARAACEPLGDRCVDARVLYEDQPESERTADLRGTSNSSGDSLCCDADWPYDEPEATVWYWFTATEESARIHTCDSHATVSDSVLQVYEAGDLSTPENTCASLSPIACNDNAVAASSCFPDRADGSDVCVSGLTIGATYYVMLAAHRRSTDAGPYVIDLEMPCPTPIHPLDHCASALELSGYTLSQVFDMIGATASCLAVESSCPASSGDVDIWFKYVPPATADFFAQVCATPDTSEFSLTVYNGCACPPGVLEASDCDVQDCAGTSFKSYAGHLEKDGCYLLRVHSSGVAGLQSARLAFCPLHVGDYYEPETVPAEYLRDCDRNGRSDACEIEFGAADCDGDAWLDRCELDYGSAYDCDGNGTLDNCDIAAGTHPDCNGDGEPDSCDIADGSSGDCNTNGVPDECDLVSGVSPDDDGDGVPNECEADCQPNGVIDDFDIALGTSDDCNEDGRPDECGTVGSCAMNRLLPWPAPFPYGYGYSVAGDADRILVGAPSDESVYSFRRTDRGWVKEARITPAIGDLRQRFFGFSVALSGSVAVIGAPEADTELSNYTGAVHVFAFSDNQWHFQQTIVPSDAESFDAFGRVLAIDGDRLLVGSWAFLDSVRIYRRTGATWEEEVRLPVPGAEFVALSGDTAATLDHGRVNFFRRVGTDWVSDGEFTPSSGVLTSLDLDGDVAVLGVRFVELGSPLAHVLRRTNGAWGLEHTISAPPHIVGAGFGTNAVVNDRRIVLIGPHGDPLCNIRYAPILLFEYSSGAWNYVDSLCGEPAQPWAGVAAALTSEFLVIGDNGTGDPFSNGGIAGVFNLNGPDCDGDTISDACAVALGRSLDCDENGVPDECACGFSSTAVASSGSMIAGCSADCQSNGTPDYLDLAAGSSDDCNADQIPDECGVTALRFDTPLLIERDVPPRYAVTMDVDGDGDQDILGGGCWPDTLLINRGEGRFDEGRIQINQTAGGYATAHGIALADLDGDGDLDYVAAPGCVLLNELYRAPWLSFESRGGISCGDEIHDIEVTDLDADGDLDLLAACGDPFNASRIAVFINDGLGNFSEAPPTEYGPGIRSLTLLDLDGDGDQDVFATNQVPGNFLVFLNRGVASPGPWFGSEPDARIPAPDVNGESTQPFAAAAGDVDHDGDEDLVAVLTGVFLVDVFLNVWPGPGSAGSGLELQTQLPLPIDSYPLFVTLVDWNGDGWLDIVTANTGGNTISTAMNLGHDDQRHWRGFAHPATSPAGNAPNWIQFADLLPTPGVEMLVANRDVHPTGYPVPGPGSVAILSEVGIVVFADDFGQTPEPLVIDPTKWAEVEGYVVVNFNYRLLMDGPGWIASRPVDLTGYNSAVLRVAAYRFNQDGSESLLVDAWDGATWRQIGAISGYGFAEDFETRFAWFEFPAEGMRPEARFRLRTTSGWELDDVTLMVRVDDCDRDTRPDLCAIAASPEADLNRNRRLDRCEFDFDGDSDVDLGDVRRLFNCYSGTGAPAPLCAGLDFFEDQTINGADFAVLVRHLSGP